MARKSTALRMIPKMTPSAEPAPSVTTAVGASAAVEGESIIVRDPAGSIVVVYDSATGSATISAPRGDLHIDAPHGKVVVSAGTELELKSTRRMSMRSEQIDIHAGQAKLRADLLTLASDAIEAVSPSMLLSIGSMRLNAQRIVEHAAEAYRSVDDLLETRAGRVRSLVRGATQWYSKSTSIVSEEDSFMDGRRVLLG